MVCCALTQRANCHPIKYIKLYTLLYAIKFPSIFIKWNVSLFSQSWWRLGIYEFKHFNSFFCVQNDFISYENYTELNDGNSIHVAYTCVRQAFSMNFRIMTHIANEVNFLQNENEDNYELLQPASIVLMSTQKIYCSERLLHKTRKSQFKQMKIFGHFNEQINFMSRLLHPILELNTRPIYFVWTARSSSMFLCLFCPDDLQIKG